MYVTYRVLLSDGGTATWAVVVIPEFTKEHDLPIAE